MNTMEIDGACFSDSFLSPIFHGTWPIDKTNEISCENGAYIFNLSDSKSPGTHWVAVYVWNGNLDFLYSFGNCAPTVLKRWGSNYFWTENPYTLQSPITAVCGQYCIYFLTQRARNVSFDHLLRNFNYDADTNYIRVYKYVRDKFGLVQPPLINTEGVVLQVAHALVEIQARCQFEFES